MLKLTILKADVGAIVLAVLTTSGVYCSYDRGFNWVPLPRLAGAPIIALALSRGPDGIDLVVAQLGGEFHSIAGATTSS